MKTLILIICGSGLVFVGLLITSETSFTSERLEGRVATPTPEIVDVPTNNESSELMSVEAAVRTYVQFAKNKDIDGMKKTTGLTPPEYFKQRAEFYKQRAANVVRSAEMVPRGDRRAKATTAVENNNGDIMMNYRIVSKWNAGTFQGISLPIKEIEGVWVKGDHGRVRALFDSVIGPTSFDFLLVKKDGTWKVFKSEAGYGENAFPM